MSIHQKIQMTTTPSLYAMGLSIWLALGSTTAIAADTPISSQTEAGTSNYTVAESIAVEKLVQKIYSGSPLTTQVLRQALTAANPKVISGNPQQRLKAGTSLVVPEHGQIVTSVLTSLSSQNKGESSSYNGPTSSELQNRRNWVRFP
jgi:Tfp pilus assembly protein FimV